MRKQHCCLVEIVLAEWHGTTYIFEKSKLILHRTNMFQYLALWFWNASTAVRIKLTHCQIQTELFCNISLHGNKTVLNHKFLV